MKKFLIIAAFAVFTGSLATPAFAEEPTKAKKECTAKKECCKKTTTCCDKAEKKCTTAKPTEEKK